MMKTNMIKAATTFKPLSLVIVLAMGVVTTNALAEDVTDTGNRNPVQDTYNNANWQTPLAVEFTNLDTSGNGLLLPNEASKGKAFNKTTFKQADADSDGSIDINEYIFFKTGKTPEDTKPEPMAQEKPKLLAVPKAPMLNETNYFL